MARKDDDDDALAVPHPREQAEFVGHAAAEAALLEAYRGGRMPHAWLIGGPQGIGKATLAYRAARLVLAHPDPGAPAVQNAASLEVAAHCPAFRRIASQAHPDLLVLERTENEKGALRSVIRVEDVRRSVGFFGATAGEGGWRVCIVDSADELQLPQAANALLKIIEEPPPRCLFLLVSHMPGRLLSTIRSRCRRLELRRLATPEVAHVLAQLAERHEKDADIEAAAAAGEGSVSRALSFLGGRALALRRRVDELLAALPDVDPVALHALGDALAGTEAAPLAIFTDAVRAWLSARLEPPVADLAQLAKVADVWEKLTGAAGDVETYNLERKPLVFEVFGSLAALAQRRAA